MALSSSDIVLYLTGGVGNTDPNLSYGGNTSTTQVGTTLNLLYDDVQPDEATTGKTEYRVVDVKNISAGDTAFTPKLFQSVATAPSTSVKHWYAYDSTGTAGLESAYGTSVADIATLALLTFTSEDTAVSYAAGVSLGGSMSPTNKRRIFIKRVTAGGAPRTFPEAGEFTIRVGG